MIWVYFKIVLFPLLHRNLRAFFSNFLLEILVGLLEVKLKNMWGHLKAAIHAFSSLKLFHTQSPAINNLLFKLSYQLLAPGSFWCS